MRACLLTLLTACNKDWEFPDYKYTTVYFAYQSPVRTLVLGEDIYDNSLDNQHKLQIMATMGGVYENKKNITLNLVVDGDPDASPVLCLPRHHVLRRDMGLPRSSAG